MMVLNIHSHQYTSEGIRVSAESGGQVTRYLTDRNSSMEHVLEILMARTQPKNSMFMVMAFNIAWTPQRAKGCIFITTLSEIL